jgi:hypothetical protein
MSSKLILIEGLPGAGKTRTAMHLGEALRQEGIFCEWFLEEDEDHPIDCSGLALNDLSEKLIPLWKSFLQDAVNDQTVTIMESRLWQNTSLFMYMAEHPIEEIIELQDRVNQALSPLSPILIYLFQPDVKVALGRLYELRDESWINWALKMTSEYSWFQSRGKDDFSGWVEFFDEWLEVAETLYNRWPHNELRVENPHDNWELAYSKINEYLRHHHIL